MLVSVIPYYKHSVAVLYRLHDVYDFNWNRPGLFFHMCVCRSKFFFLPEKKHSQHFFSKLFFFVFKKEEGPAGPPGREKGGSGGSPPGNLNKLLAAEKLFY